MLLHFPSTGINTIFATVFYLLTLLLLYYLAFVASHSCTTAILLGFLFNLKVAKLRCIMANVLLRLCEIFVFLREAFLSPEQGQPNSC
jgi:hypothetical protein